MALIIFSVTAAASIATAFPGQTTRVSVDSAGVAANAGSTNGVLSADGRYVVFQSSATNLVTGASGTQVYRHDRTSGATLLVSVTSTGNPGNNVSRDPTVSANGRYVAFASFATDLVGGDTNGLSDVFVRDMQTPTTALVSSAGAPADGSSGLSGLSGAREISDDGRYVAFTSSATNLAAGTNNGKQQIYVKDMATGAVVRASVNALTGEAGDRTSQTPSISGNGQVVAFRSESTNFSPLSTSGVTPEIFARDLVAGTTTLESAGAAATGRSATTPVLSFDGRYLAFESTGVLDPRDLDNGTLDIYLRDRVAGTTVLASLSNNPLPGATSASPSISGDGRWVAFHSLDDKLVVGDVNGLFDVFIYDRTTETIKLVSLNDADQQADAASFGPSVSFDGHLVLFGSTATNLAAGSGVGNQLYVRNLISNQAPVLPPFGQAIPLLEAQPLQLTSEFTDTDSTSWTGTVNWGDGSSTQPLALNANKTFALDHLYAPGAYDLTVAITDDAGATGSLVIHAAVSNVAPSVNLSSTMYLALTRTLDTTGTFTDPGSNETYSATVNYGDGTGTQTLALGPYDASPLVGGSFTLHHTYAAAGTYNVAVTVSDGRGGSTIATMTVKVNQAPVLRAFGNIPLLEAQPLQLTSEFTDTDSTSWTGTVNWGDGSSTQPLALNANKTFFLDHLYAPGAYDLTVAITDDAGATGSLVIHVVDSNVAPSVNVSSTMDLAFTKTLDASGTFTDPGSNETYSATVNYGDGTGTQTLALGPYDASPLVGGSFTLHHTYAAAGPYTVTVIVSDSHGGSTSATMLVNLRGYTYQWLDPLGDMFVVGRNLPVKFTVHGLDGSFVLDQSVRVDVVDASGNVMAGPYLFGDQPSRSVMVSNDSYHVNVDTRDLTAGMYWLRVQFSSPTLTGEFRLATTGTSSASATSASTRTRTAR